MQRACGWRELSIFEKLKEGSHGRRAEQAVSRLLTVIPGSMGRSRGHRCAPPLRGVLGGDGTAG